ncbi:MAG: PAS domain S-box protein [Candidatus Paceibacterota bacterium]
MKKEKKINIDNIESKKIEMKIVRMDRALKMIRDVNQTLVRAADETTLLNNICHIVVEIGGYRLVWIGFVEQDEEKTIRPVAYAGFDSSYIEKAKLTYADTPRGRGPGGVAIRTGEISIARDIATDPAMIPWREDALKRGYQSIIALPLMNEGKTFGVIGVYSNETDAFNDDEIKILKELAGDLAYGITTLRIRADEKKYKEALIRSETELNEAQRIGLFGSFDWDALTDTIVWSNEYYRIYGFDPKQKPPKYEEHLKTYSPESASKLDALVKRSMKTGEPYEVDLEQARSDGTKKWFTARGEVKRDKNNKIIGLRGTAQDITERKRAEEKIEDSEKKYSTLVEKGNDGILIMRYDGVLSYVNSIICKLVGYKREEVIGKSLLNYVSSEYRKIIAERYKKRLSGQDVASRYEIEILSKNGQKVPVEVNASLIDYEGRPAVMAIVRDITERKRSEEELKKSKELTERLNRIMIGREIKMMELKKEINDLIKNCKGKNGN